MHKIVKILKESRIVDSVLSVDSDAFGEYYKLKIKARLVNGWMLHIWEHATPISRRYAYHVSKEPKLIIRWDNAPHHRKIKTYPHHKHVNDIILESKEVTVEEILEKLETMIKDEN